MDHERLDDWLEKSILGLILLALCYGPLALGAVEKKHFIVIQGLVTGALFLWMARLWLAPDRRVLWAPTCWGIIAFGVYAGVRYSHSEVEYLARQEFIRILVYAALFFVALNNLHRQEHVKTLSTVLVLLGFAISAYAIFQFITGSQKIWNLPQPSQYYGRSSGTYICPNHLSGLLEMLVPISLACALQSRLGHVTRILFFYAAVVMLAGIGVTVSRGGYITTGLSILVLFGILFRRRGYRIAILVCSVLMVLGAWWFLKSNYAIQKRLDESFPSLERVDDMRFRIWKPALAIWQEYPWFGVGPDHFDLHFPQYRPVNFQFDPQLVHNDYLNLLTDYGAAGFTLVLLTWLVAAWGVAKTWKHVRRNPDQWGSKASNKSTFVLGGGVALLAVLIHSSMDFNLHIPANALVMSGILAVVSSHWRHATNTWWVKPRWYGCALISAGILTLVFYLSLQTLAAAKEQYAARLVEAPGRTNQQRAQAMKRAWAADPRNYKTSRSLGEFYRLWSWNGNSDYAAHAEEAIEWFRKTVELNPYDYYSYLRLGMCLDWLNRFEEAAPWFARAEPLDPNGYFTMGLIGWHHLQTGDFRKSLEYFTRSKKLTNIMHMENELADAYLPFVRKKLAEANTRR